MNDFAPGVTHCLPLACSERARTSQAAARRDHRARLFLPEKWTHGSKAEFSVVYELRRPGKPSRSDSKTDLPGEFTPDLIVTFSDSQLIGCYCPFFSIPIAETKDIRAPCRGSRFRCCDVGQGRNRLVE
jgi:hypothetical protein